MNTELRNKVWSVLPKEFKEEVKKEYYDCKHCNADACAIELETVFGKHNLTSDVEGEEMLTCDRDVVRMLYDRADSVKVRQMLESLFGSKCLPDDTKEPKPAAPKFKVGDKVIYENFIGTVHQIEETDYVFRNSVGGDLIGWINESDLKPYTAPTEKRAEKRAENAQERATCTDDCSGKRSCQSRNLSQNIADCHTHICNRLTIAAMAMQGILANSHREMVDMKIDKVAELAIEAADALIAECEKGGNDV